MSFRTGLFVACLVIAHPISAQSIEQAKVGKVKLKIQDTTDRFTGGRWIRSSRPLDLEKTGLLTTLALSPGIIVEDGKPPILYASIYYRGYGWAFLNGKAFFVIGGHRYTATGEDSSGRREVAACSASAGCINEEVERLLPTRELAHAIANASDGEVKVTGEKGFITGRLNATHVAYFRAMIDRFEAMGGSYFSESMQRDKAKPEAIQAERNEPAQPQTSTAEQEPDPAKRCDACSRIGKP